MPAAGRHAPISKARHPGESAGPCQMPLPELLLGRHAPSGQVRPHSPSTPQSAKHGAIRILGSRTTGRRPQSRKLPAFSLGTHTTGRRPPGAGTSSTPSRGTRTTRRRRAPGPGPTQVLVPSPAPSPPRAPPLPRPLPVSPLARPSPAPSPRWSPCRVLVPAISRRH
ncbi:hypothetical protein HMPREF0058_2375 [Actinomyces urogenitalis DSM 15434]|uniref:Uncharacterized protein n=1 Tax=Actinomyces urogenitalis DSM 15434 TaxID=525246 RepID=C0W931_9ACTO|nr:hypothetical protein HMPREF0058_2375 [Actinomyces urogenitalis DSM 15434]